MLAFWLKACSIKIGTKGWQNRVMKLIPDHMGEDVYGWLDFNGDGSEPQSPVAAAAALLRTVHQAYPDDEAIAFLLADIRLAHDLRWPSVFPFFGQHLTGKDFKADEDVFLVDCHRTVSTTAQNAVRQAYDLARRSTRLREVAPKLRAKGADAALELFLSEVAVTPSSMLSPKIRSTNLQALWVGIMNALAEKQEPEYEPSSTGLLDRELEHLPQELRWREWMNRIEAVIFASSEVVERDKLHRLVGQGANIDLLIADIHAELKGRPYELVGVAGGWMHRTRSEYSDAIKAAAEIGDQKIGLNETEMAVLCAIAYHQPLDRAGLADIFGKEINREVLNRLRYQKLIANGPRAPRPGAPHTFVTTSGFLAMFDLQSLRDLPELKLSTWQD